MSVGSLIGKGASMMNRKFWSWFGDNPAYSQFLMDPKDGLDVLIKAVVDGKLKCVLDETSPFGFDNFQKMFEKQMSHTAHGKLVIEFRKYEGDLDKDEVEEKKDDVPVEEDKKKVKKVMILRVLMRRRTQLHVLMK